MRSTSHHSRVSSRAVRDRRSVAFESLEGRRLLSATFYVSTRGNDANPGTDPAHPWRHIQHAFDVATPGSTVDVLHGIYHEKLTDNVSGNAVDGFITFQAVGKVTIDGTRVAGSDIIDINNHNYIRISGFTIANDLRVDNGSGIRLTSADDHIEILNNRIHNILGSRAAAITIYGSDPNNGISNLVISGNEVFDCQPYPGEAITLKGNVHDFAVTNNYVHDVDGIGIDFIGGDGVSPDPLTDMTRNGTCSGNLVTRARSFVKNTIHEAIGIMVDGAQNIIVERNTCRNDQVGIEVGCVAPGIAAMNNIVRDNLLYNNVESGLSIGGSAEFEGRVTNCQFTNNTIYHNNTEHDDVDGEIRLQFASNNLIENNLVVASAGVPLMNIEYGATGNSSDYNLFFAPGGTAGAHFTRSEHPLIGLAKWKALTANETHSIFATPKFGPARSGFLRLKSTSPGVNAGDPLFITGSAETDFPGQLRILGGRVDVGAYEVGSQPVGSWRRAGRVSIHAGYERQRGPGFTSASRRIRGLATLVPGVNQG